MSQVPTLVAEKQRLEAQIAAAKPQAVREVLAFMEAMGVTWGDLGVSPQTASRPAGAKRRVKFADPNGNAWSGVGQRPRWLTAALADGASLEQFRVKA